MRFHFAVSPAGGAIISMRVRIEADEALIVRSRPVASRVLPWVL